ncbi:MAG: signal transduction histidine kinase [Gammaproteobacteria bacterium]|jgi:signal transduction histidine kinase
MMVSMDALDSVWPQAEAKSIELDPRIEVDEARVSGDAALLGRVLVNLLTNAVKYSPAGASVGIELMQEGSEICCCVFDTGYGIAPQDLEHLFDSYQRIERQEHATERGIGLGLAFVEATVKRHGGRIEVASELNKGSRFSVILPAAMDSSQT